LGKQTAAGIPSGNGCQRRRNASVKAYDQQVLIQYRMEQGRTALEEADVLFSRSISTFGAENRTYYAMF
jgi:hypothetical protein